MLLRLSVTRHYVNQVKFFEKIQKFLLTHAHGGGGIIRELCVGEFA